MLILRSLHISEKCYIIKNLQRHDRVATVDDLVIPNHSYFLSQTLWARVCIAQNHQIPFVVAEIYILDIVTNEFNIMLESSMLSCVVLQSNIRFSKTESCTYKNNRSNLLQLEKLRVSAKKELSDSRNVLVMVGKSSCNKNKQGELCKNYLKQKSLL